MGKPRGNNIKGMRNFKEFSKEELSEVSRRGGIKAQQVLKEKRTVKKVAEMVLTLKAPMQRSGRQALAKHFGVRESEIDVLFASLAAIAEKAMAGDIKAFEVLRDSSGQKPKENMAMTHDFLGDASIRVGYELTEDMLADAEDAE